MGRDAIALIMSKYIYVRNKIFVCSRNFFVVEKTFSARISKKICINLNIQKSVQGFLSIPSAS